jgi:superfamily II DNA or RNA helicase
MLGNVQEKGNRGFFICHRQELVDQTAKTFDKTGIDYGYIAAGHKPNYFKPIQICSIDTLKNRIEHVPLPTVCLWDEAHHLRAAGWTKVHDFYDKAYHVGLSGTPQRLDGKGLDDRFDFLVPGPSVSWLIANKFLAEYKLYSIPGANRDSLGSRMGDFIKSQSETMMDKPAITGNIVSHWKKYAQGKLTIGFAISRKLSEKYAQEFTAAGIPSIHLDGETPKAERKRKLKQFAKGEYRVVWNVGLFGEGFDVAANSGMDVTVGCVIDAAPTQSLTNWLQRCGRALRPQEGHAIILDHAGNLPVHGLPCQEREWTLAGREDVRRGSEEDAGAPIRQCEQCYHVHKPAPKCPECGYVYPVQHREIEEVKGDLQEIDPAAQRAQIFAEQGQADTAEKLKKLEAQRGHKPGWADHVERARQEKKELQTKLFNLIVGARTMGISTGLNSRDVYKMKPKALKESIAVIDLMMRQQPQYN